MSDREVVLGAVQAMPEDLTIREIVDESLLLDEVKQRLAKTERGVAGVPHEEVANKLNSWITE